MISRKLFNTFIVVTISIFLFLPILQIDAEGGEVKGDVTVAAFVPSKVSKAHSTVTQNVSEVLADGIQRAIITVTLRDEADNLMDNLKVLLKSNRGDIDEINALTAADGAILGSGENFVMTNAQGMAFFEVKSTVPGESVFTPLADSLIALNSVSITFLSLPFPKNVTISAEVPKFISPTGEITLLKPSGEKAPGEKSEKDKIVNLGVNVKIPFWIMTLVAFSLVMNISLFILVIIMMLKTRKTEEKEDEILEKEEEVLEEISKKGS